MSISDSLRTVHPACDWAVALHRTLLGLRFLRTKTGRSEDLLELLLLTIENRNVARVSPLSTSHCARPRPVLWEHRLHRHAPKLLRHQFFQDAAWPGVARHLDRRGAELD